MQIWTEPDEGDEELGWMDIDAIQDPDSPERVELWLLTHPESRHLRRVSTVYGHLSRNLLLS